MNSPTLSSVLELLESDYIPQREARAGLAFLVSERARLQSQRDELLGVANDYRDTVRRAEKLVQRVLQQAMASIAHTHVN